VNKNIMIIALGAALYLVLRAPVMKATGLAI
jgi:hypothetical protein